VHSTKLYKQFSKGAKKKASPVAGALFKKCFAFFVLFIVGAALFPKDLDKTIEVHYKKSLERLNLQIKKVDIYGNEKVETAVIEKHIGNLEGENIYLVDLEDVRNKVSQEPWVAHVIVERVLPSTLQIHILEESPQALFIDGNEAFLINLDGKKIQKVDRNSYNDYLKVSGKNANVEFKKLLDLLYKSVELYQNLDTISLLNERRWNLELKNKSLIKLPEKKLDEAITAFSMHFAKLTQIDKRYVVDLRLIPDRIYIESE
jgi:cell division protein FtsQ